MLRTILVACPFVVLAAVSCGDSGGSDTGGTSGSANFSGEPSSAAGESSSTGGTTSSAGTTAAGGKGTAGTTSVEGGAPSGTAGMTNSEAGSPTMAGGAAAAGAGGAGAAQCLDIFGTYKIQSAAGKCGTLNKGAPQTIDGDDVTCVAKFVSAPAKGEAAINGSTALDADGNFTKAKLSLGDALHEPCTGTWNAQAQSLTVKCGAPGNICTIMLDRQ